MLEIPHVLVASSLALNIPNPAVALSLSFISHFALDILPHWNPSLDIHGEKAPTDNRLIFIDSLGALIIGVVIALTALPDTNRVIIVLLACFLGVLPDVIKIPYFYFHSKNKHLKAFVLKDNSIQNDVSPFWGVVSQIIICGAALWWIF